MKKGYYKKQGSSSGRGASDQIPLCNRRETLPPYCGVNRVDPRYHHVQHHNTQHVSEDSQRDFSWPLALHFSESNFSNDRLSECETTGSEICSPLIFLKEQIEVVAHQENEDVGRTGPDYNAHNAEREELDERPEDASHFEGEEETQNGKGEEHPEEVGLAYFDLRVKQKLLRTLGRPLEFVLFFDQLVSQVNKVPFCQVDLI